MNELTSDMAAVEMGGEEAEMASKNILKCVQVLRNYQDEANEVKKAYLEELVSLERKYQGLFQPIYDKRASIISGAEAPSLTEKEKENALNEARTLPTRQKCVSRITDRPRIRSKNNK